MLLLQEANNEERYLGFWGLGVVKSVNGLAIDKLIGIKEEGNSFP